MPDYNHGDFDTTVVVHIQHAFIEDSDVVIILIGSFFKLALAHPIVTILVAFGTGYYDISSICNTLAEPKACALPVFHAL